MVRKSIFNEIISYYLHQREKLIDKEYRLYLIKCLFSKTDSTESELFLKALDTLYLVELPFYKCLIYKGSVQKLDGREYKYDSNLRRAASKCIQRIAYCCQKKDKQISFDRFFSSSYFWKWIDKENMEFTQDNTLEEWVNENKELIRKTSTYLSQANETISTIVYDESEEEQPLYKAFYRVPTYYYVFDEKSISTDIKISLINEGRLNICI